MRTITNYSKSFSPVGIYLVFESQEEIDAFYAIFNHGKILSAVKRTLNGSQIRDAIQEINGIPEYKEFHKRLSAEFAKD